MSHFLADDGEKIHVQISGDGSPLVLLHGWTASHRDWFPFLGQLAGKHRVFRWDARGHGGHSLTTMTAPTVQRMARDLHNLLEHFNLVDAVVAGHSMGALTLWQYVRDFGTKRIGKACFIDQSPKLLTDDSWDHGIYGSFNRDRSRAFIARLNEDFAEAVLELTAFGLNARAREKYQQNAPGWQKSRDHLGGQSPGPLITCWESLTQADYRDVLEEIDVPSMLIYGSESNFYPTDTARYVASRIPRAILHIYEGTDHSPHQWQRERFVKDLLDFIEG
ncbi:MAG TPA: alpha/beta hydrolase [Rhodocyclaceae bacterium]|nr:alpha/beta hydrolase [Rhodocyclaceae bacterium]